MPLRLFVPKLVVACVLVCSVPWVADSQLSQGESLEILLGERLRISERSNLSLRHDGRYVGLINRQVDAHVSRDAGASGPGSFAYVGRVLSYSKTRRDMQQVGRPIDASFVASIQVNARRGFIDSREQSQGPIFPSYVGVPSLPAGATARFRSWEEPAWLVIDLPDGAGPVTLETVVAYRYEGLDTYGGEPVHRITAGFATRYPYIVAPDEEPPPPIEREDVEQIMGRHDLTILLPVDYGAPLFIRDEINEQYRYSNGSSDEVRGHVLLFVYGLATQSRSQIAAMIEADLEDAETVGVDVEETSEGTRVTLHDIHFVPDQAIILPDEWPRLASLADALSGLGDVRFLIVGHTADVGSEESQVALSIQRAEVMAREFATRGIEAGRIDVEGRGGSEPIGDNTTDEGRARNRRVEIYVLEQ